MKKPKFNAKFMFLVIFLNKKLLYKNEPTIKSNLKNNNLVNARNCIIINFLKLNQLFLLQLLFKVKGMFSSNLIFICKCITYITLQLYKFKLGTGDIAKIQRKHLFKD